MAYLGHGHKDIVNVTAVAAGGLTKHYPGEEGIATDGAVVFSLQIKATATLTFTIEATLAKLNECPTTNWVDITQAFEDLNTGLKSSSVSASDTILQCNGLNVERLRLVVVEPAAGNYDLCIKRRVI